MAETRVPVGSPLAVKKYSVLLAEDVPKLSYFYPRFVGNGNASRMPIQKLEELTNDAGDNIQYDLLLQLRQQPIEGDATQEGTEEDLSFYSDTVYIDQARAGVNSGGRMTRKRTIRDLRALGRTQQADWWARFVDEVIICYLSGKRGSNTGFTIPTSWTGRANNSLTTPDTAHQLFANANTAASTLAQTTDKITLAEFDKFLGKVAYMGGGSQGIPRLQPISIEGEKKFVSLISPAQEYDLRTNSSTGQWLDIQKAAAANVGLKSPIFKGSCGDYNGVVIHKHENVIWDTSGASSAKVSRALFLGVQAAVIAFGSPGTSMPFNWNEETEDRGNKVVITSSVIFGCKKSTFNGYDYGVICLDTAHTVAADAIIS